MRRLLLSFFFFIQCLLLPQWTGIPSTVLAADETAAQGIEHVRVVWVEHPEDEAVISWTTREAGVSHRVYYDSESHKDNPEGYAHTAATFQDGKFTLVSKDTAWSAPGWYHHAHLADLRSGTTYYVRIASDEHLSREYHFRTAPGDDEPVALLYGADSRIGRESGPSGGLDPYEHTDRRNIFRRMASLMEQHPEIVALAFNGDYCLSAEWRYMDRWLEDYELTTTRAGRLLPIIPGRGNHEGKVGFEEMFTWPDLHRDYYFTTRLSGEVAMISLNTNLDIRGEQRDWLEVQLRELHPTNRWLFVQYHVPAYGSAKSIRRGAAQRQYWVPLFEEYGVNLIGEADHHTLKRTVPIRYGAPDPENGIIYIGDGGLGVPQRTPETANRWWLQDPGFAASADHVHLIEFGQEEMRVRAIGPRGNALDDFTVTPSRVAAD